MHANYILCISYYRNYLKPLEQMKNRTKRAITDKQLQEEGKARMGAGIKNVFWHMYGRDDARKEGQLGHSFTSLKHVKRIDPVIFGMV